MQKQAVQKIARIKNFLRIVLLFFNQQQKGHVLYFFKK